MNGTVKYFKPGKVITLFDSHLDNVCAGALIFDHPEFSILSQSGIRDIGEIIKFHLELLDDYTKNFWEILRSSLAWVFLLLAVFCIVAVLTPVALAQFNFSYSKQSSIYQPKQTFGQVGENFNPSPTPSPSSWEFQINIPKINLLSDITENVDISSEQIYKKLLKEDGVAHASGSYLPGQGGPVFLFAHSTDTLVNIPLFNAKFFNLKDLENGDTIEISYHGNKYKYLVKDKKVINPNDLDTIRKTHADLMLMTCVPPGTDWQRLVIFADKLQY